MAEVNGRLFLNNVSLGIYGDAVRQPTYRDAKARTLAQTAAQVLGPSAPAAGLKLVDDRGRSHRDPSQSCSSRTTRTRSSRRTHPAPARPSTAGSLGVDRARPAGRRPGRGADVDGDATRGDSHRSRPRRHRRRGRRARPAAPVRHPARTLARISSRRGVTPVARAVERSKPADLSVGGLRSPAGRARRQETWSFSFSLPTRSSTPA